ncbi:MAG: beta/gamma crystallin-related protein [Prochloraceae cyanobacterium]|nr:beta/gamma crystallin-related protein [Prochloraceae cyanobacterium]
MAEIILYVDTNLQGPSTTFTHSSSHIGELFQDKVTSAKVISGKWQLFEHADFKGRSIILFPGEYRNLDIHPGGIPNDSITSIKVV